MKKEGRNSRTYTFKITKAEWKQLRHKNMKSMKSIKIRAMKNIYIKREMRWIFDNKVKKPLSSIH